MEEALFLEQARAYFPEMKEVGKNAPFWKCLDAAEQFAVEKGRELIRSSLESIIQDRVDEIEKKIPTLAEEAGDIEATQPTPTNSGR